MCPPNNVWTTSHIILPVRIDFWRYLLLAALKKRSLANFSRDKLMVTHSRPYLADANSPKMTKCLLSASISSKKMMLSCIFSTKAERPSHLLCWVVEVCIFCNYYDLSFHFENFFEWEGEQKSTNEGRASLCAHLNNADTNFWRGGGPSTCAVKTVHNSVWTGRLTDFSHWVRVCQGAAIFVRLCTVEMMKVWLEVH